MCECVPSESESRSSARIYFTERARKLVGARVCGVVAKIYSVRTDPLSSPLCFYLFSSTSTQGRSVQVLEGSERVLA